MSCPILEFEPDRKGSLEPAAFFAVAEFREVIFGQLLYGGDDVSAEKWDHRGWNITTTVREKLFWLAVEAALALDSEL